MFTIIELHIIAIYIRGVPYMGAPKKKMVDFDGKIPSFEMDDEGTPMNASGPMMAPTSP